MTTYDAQLRILERQSYDPSTRLTTWHLRYEVDRPGQPQQVFHREHLLRHHTTAEFIALLSQAGFEGISMRRGYTGPASADHSDDRIFSARRPNH